MTIYEARAVECLDCDNWEEQGLHDPRSHFTLFSFEYITGNYTCLACKGVHVKESCIREQRED